RDYYLIEDYYGGYYGAGAMKAVSVNERFDSSEDSSITVPTRATNGFADGDYAVNEAETGAIADSSKELNFSPSPTEKPSESGGEENTAYVRRNFADCPVFTNVELDGNGEGVLTFTVPDNITSWRLTAVATDTTDGDFSKVRLGNAVSDLICTQDFFINLSAPEYYIEGDDAALLARSFGTASDGEVKYTARLVDADGNEVANASATDDSKGYAELNFGKIPAGTYTATVTAKCKDSSDALESQFSVVESAEMIMTRKEVSPDEIQSISPAMFPVTLTFSDGTTGGTIDRAISELMWQDDCSRSDALAAKYAADKAASRLWGWDVSDSLASDEDMFDDYGYGLISLLTYSDGDVELTARILMASPELITSSRRGLIVSALYEIAMAKEQRDDVTLCAALSGLASLDEPILDVLYQTASVAGNYSYEAKLYLAAALAELGDWSAAYDIYSQIKDEIGVADYENGTLKFEGETFDDTVRLSSLALSVSSIMSSGDAEATAKYLLENRSWTEDDTLGLATFVGCFMPDVEYTEKTVTYRTNGKEITESVTPFGTVAVTLTKGGLESFEIVAIDEGVAISASYLARPSEALDGMNDNGRISITKGIEHYQNGLYLVTLTVSGTSTRVSESFDISDVIPAGARYFSSYDDTWGSTDSGKIHTGAYIYNSAGQKISGHVWVWNDVNDDWRNFRTECPEYSFSVSVSYVIRGAVKGEFIAESAVIRNLSSNVYSASERHTVTISDDERVISKQ
ncbi:MAG: hypothetical protein IJQ80_05755, partial [Clostridia bacterium]|nr:hypothetical protein [Clostridia bacterium]